MAGLSKWAAVGALSAPLAGVMLYLAVLTLGELAGAELFAARAPANLAEAAGSARADLVIRYLRQGEDPRRVFPIHRDIISSYVLFATPIEAAVWSRQAQLIALFDRHGAFTQPADRLAIACLASDVGATDIVEYLMPGDPPECVPGAAQDAVSARTPREEER